MAPIDPGEFRADAPEAFYLLDSGEDFRSQADAAIEVQGVRLPVHSQILSHHSPVLSGLFTDLRPAPEPSPGRGLKRATDEEEPILLKAPFEEASLFEAALYLRLCYRPADMAGPGSLKAVQGSLLALLRLAHKLAAEPFLQGIAGHMSDSVEAAKTAILLVWMDGAEACHLEPLRSQCLRELARRMAASGAGGLASAVADTSLLARHCTRTDLAQMLAMLAAAGGQQSLNNLAPPEALQQALSEAANPATFTWSVEGFSALPASTGWSISSPDFAVAGRRWHMKLYPGGNRPDAAGHISVSLKVSAPARARWALTVVDQGFDQPQGAWTCSPGTNEYGTTSGCLPKVMAHEQLRSRPGYLAGNRLVLRATVEVVL